MENERQLLNSARKLDEKALLEIYDHFAPKVYGHALYMCHDPVRADDIVSKAFKRLLDELAEGRGPDRDLQTYLFRSADRLVMDP